MSYCQSCVNCVIVPLCRLKSPSWAEAQCSCQGVIAKPSQATRILKAGASNLPQDSYICVPTSRWAIIVIFICAIMPISLIRGDVGRGDVGQGNEAGEALKKKILTAPPHVCGLRADAAQHCVRRAKPVLPAWVLYPVCQLRPAPCLFLVSTPALYEIHTLQQHSVIHVGTC